MKQTKSGSGQRVTTLPVNECNDNAHDDEDGDEGSDKEVSIASVDWQGIVGTQIERSRGGTVFWGLGSHGNVDMA